jgi:hypothetical protein
MADSPALGFTYIESAQSQKEVSINEALDSVDDHVEPVDVAIIAGANVVSASNYAHGVIRLTGALGAGATVELPDTLSKNWLVINATTGGQTVQAKVGSGGTLRTITANEAILIWDGGYQPVGSGASSHTHTASQITDFQEAVEDRIGAAVVAGSGVSVSYDDGSGETTISASGVVAGARTITAVFDGGGLALTAGAKARLRIPFAATIDKVTLLADQNGDVVVDIWLDDFASYPPDNADSITAGNEPELTGADTFEDSTLTGWTTSISAGDCMIFNIDSASTLTWLMVQLELI